MPNGKLFSTLPISIANYLLTFTDPPNRLFEFHASSEEHWGRLEGTEQDGSATVSAYLHHVQDAM